MTKSIEFYLNEWLIPYGCSGNSFIAFNSSHHPNVEPYRVFINRDEVFQGIENCKYHLTNFKDVSIFGLNIIPYGINDSGVVARPTMHNIFKRFHDTVAHNCINNSYLLYKIHIRNYPGDDFYYMNNGIILDKYMMPVMLLYKADSGHRVLAINSSVNLKDGIIEKYVYSKKFMDAISRCYSSPMITYTDLHGLVEICSTKLFHNNITRECRSIVSINRKRILGISNQNEHK